MKKLQNQYESETARNQDRNIAGILDSKEEQLSWHMENTECNGKDKW